MQRGPARWAPFCSTPYLATTPTKLSPLLRDFISRPPGKHCRYRCTLSASVCPEFVNRYKSISINMLWEMSHELGGRKKAILYGFSQAQTPLNTVFGRRL